MSTSARIRPSRVRDSAAPIDKGDDGDGCGEAAAGEEEGGKEEEEELVGPDGLLLLPPLLAPLLTLLL